MALDQCEGGSRCDGVELKDGRKIEAKVVISNADPKRTFQRLVEPECLDSDFLTQVEGIAGEGMTFNIHFAMSGLPEFKAFPGRGAGPQHQGLFWIAPTVEYLERAWDEAKFGQPAREPYLTGIYSLGDGPINGAAGQALHDRLWAMGRPITLRMGIGTASVTNT